jgi:hypothetical protein
MSRLEHESMFLICLRLPIAIGEYGLAPYTLIWVSLVSHSIGLLRSINNLFRGPTIPFTQQGSIRLDDNGRPITRRDNPVAINYPPLNNLELFTCMHAEAGSPI